MRAVGGPPPASVEDFKDLVSDSMWKILVFVPWMDYEVFLLTRIRERYDATGDTKQAVAQGLRQRGDDLERRSYGRGVCRLRGHGDAVDQGDRPGAVGGDRGAGDDGDHGPLELVAARPLARALPRAEFERAPA